MSLLWKAAVAINGIEVHHEPAENGGTYRAHAYGDVEHTPLAYLRYLHSSPETVGVDMIHTRPSWRRRGLASTLLDRLREDHPGKALVTEDFSATGDKFNRGYQRSRGEGITALHPGDWWAGDEDDDWDSEGDE